jgi:glycosyltransferase involved in cell wall biosynthesis
MKVLLLIPHKLSDDRHQAVQKGMRPQTDFDAVAEALRAMPGGQADILDWNSVERDGGWLVRLVRRLWGYNLALAVLGYRQCRQYDAVLTHSEAIGLPFAIMISTLLRRPRHVTTAYYLNGKRNVVWYRILRAHYAMDKIFTLARDVYETGKGLRIPEGKLIYVEACGYIDAGFFLAGPSVFVNERQLCSVGVDFRDYRTLLEAVAGLPGITLKIEPTSNWSRHHGGVDNQHLPANVEICRLELGAVRRLYGESAVVVVPLIPNPIGAGMQTLIETMAMGKPVIITRSRDGSYAGRRDIIDGNNVILVDVGDVAGLRSAIERLMNDPDLRRRIGANARKWAEERAGRAEWLDIVIGALRAGPVSGSTAAPDQFDAAGRSTQPYGA